MKYGRDLLRDVEGYAPGEQPSDADVIKLNTNENPYPPSPKVIEAISGYGSEALRRYPDAMSVGVRRVWAKLNDYENEDWVFAGNGMDEILAMTLRTFVDPGQDVVTPNPSYTLYEILCKLHGARIRNVDLDDDYRFTEDFYAARGAVCFVPRPNAPSGVCVSRESMARLCEEFDGIVFIDEAYADFAEDSCIDFPKRFDNAIVGRTFSKSYSLAGMRLGTATASPDLIREFMKTKDSYNVNGITQAAGVAALEDRKYFEETVGRIKATRQRLTTSLRELGFVVPDSQANFVLARRDGTPTAKEIFEALRERRIFVRYFDAPGLENALRISVGTDDEIDALLGAMDFPQSGDRRARLV